MKTALKIKALQIAAMEIKRVRTQEEDPIIKSHLVMTENQLHGIIEGLKELEPFRK